MTIGLRNRTKRPIVINFDPAVYKGADSHERHLVKTHHHNPKTGVITNHAREKNLPSSLTLIGGEERTGLHASLAHQDDVKRYIEARELVLTTDEEAAVEPPAEAPKAEVPATAPTTTTPATAKPTTKVKE